jgi:small-conductance mechanosensitive channel
MSDLAAYERRITAALDRIAQRIEAGGAPAAAPASPPKPAGADDATLTHLREALEKERATNAQLSERLASARQRQDGQLGQLERRVARLTEQLDLQSLEMLRLKKANSRLMEANAALRESYVENFPDHQMINRSISADLEALQAERRAEMAEMEEILSELKPLVAADGRAAS